MLRFLLNLLQLLTLFFFLKFFNFIFLQIQRLVILFVAIKKLAKIPRKYAKLFRHMGNLLFKGGLALPLLDLLHLYNGLDLLDLSAI